ncbi:TetR family transcriptional regulator [Aeromicrobium endophyticum]|uniref:TetR/AcrR family transcriptional regulator n=1 Tax=Aeromicrobium endophyticum TaxID=2292704 RepID=UPI001314C877|nr:TetR family transcriptional regulator [Aeromicrobium endophyticum]
MSDARARGRPRRADAVDRRAAILGVARGEFAAKGFAGVSMRAVARAAGVDASLVSHYFGSKEGLLVATMDLPVDPVAKIAAVVASGPDGLGERLVRTFATSWDPHRDVFSSLVRTSLGSGDGDTPVAQVAREVLGTQLVDVLAGDDRELRAALVASQLIGMATFRYVVRLPAVADASVDDLVRWYAPAVQRLVDS